jgi:hypothetical protein
MAAVDLHKHTLNLRDGDYQYLDTVYRDRKVSAAAVIRALVSTHVDALRQHEKKLSPSDERINVDDLDRDT